jgi:hypothetical protein
VTIDSRASVTTATPDITKGLPKRKTIGPYLVKTASGENISVLQKLMELIMR